MLSEPVRICKKGARTGFNLLGVSKLRDEVSPTERFQLRTAVLCTVSTFGATGLEFASSTLPMRRVALVLVGGSLTLSTVDRSSEVVMHKSKCG